jgi:LmbE family N-acetylglucosaminyl deacetylase
MRILCIGAHPDDCEFRCGGTTALWCRQGNQVTILSVTNGQSGHHKLPPEQVSIRRKKEAAAASRIIGAESVVLPLPDGTLEPSVENRLMLMRSIRQIAPDIIITNRPNDYHPDHRYTSQLVQDCAYMLMVPNVASDVTPLRYNPVMFYWRDAFKDPVPFQPNVVINIEQAEAFQLCEYGSQPDTESLARIFDGM